MAKPIIPNLRTTFESIRTIVGNENQVRRELGLPMIVRANTTLNQHLKILANVATPSTQIPTVGYFCIGMGGVDWQNCDNNTSTLPFPKFYQHTADKTGLFKIMPFVMRELNNDLTPTERARYGLRRRESFKGVEYYAYYLKRLNLNNVNVETKLITTNADKTKTEREFNPQAADLSPQPKTLTVLEENVLKATYARTLAPVRVEITEEDAHELMNVFNILHGAPEKAFISEIGLVSGIDRVTEVATPSGNVQFKEVLIAQIAHIASVMQMIGSSNGGFTRMFNIGINEPIMNVTQE